MTRRQNGSMLLEAAITMPLYVILVFVIIQMSFVWVAKEVTHYAAYCGARAALVYNPVDYAPSRDYGVVKKAAMTPLSWISWSLNAPGDWNNFRIGWTEVIRRSIRNPANGYQGCGTISAPLPISG